MPTLRPRWTTPLLLALAASLGLGCFARTARETVFDDGYTEVILRSQQRGGEPIDRGFQHPVAIAPVRVAHILSRIDMRIQEAKKNERRPAVPTETLYTIAEEISKALQAADSSQEIVVQSIRRTKHWGVFDRFYLTSLLCYLKDDLFFVHVSRSDWEVPQHREDRLPETHAGEYPLKFTLLVSNGMTLVDSQAVAADWRDPVFKKPTRTRITPGGRVVRRTILMESEDVDATDYGPTPQLNQDLSAQDLRDLADLEEERDRGELTETEYNAKRNRILRGEEPPPATGADSETPP
jgi:hypothetical protein